MQLPAWDAIASNANVCGPALAGAAGVAGTLCSYVATAFLSPRLTVKYRVLSKRDQRDWNARPGHILHAAVVTLLVAATLICCPQFVHDDALPSSKGVLHATSLLSISTFWYSLGYFFADTAIMLSTQGFSLMLIHHIGGIIALAGTMLSTKCHLYGLLLLSTEMTTPFINVRWLLVKADRKSTQLFLVNSVCIFFGWVLGRILLFIYLFQHMWERRDVMSTFPLYVQTLAPGIAIVLFTLNLLWFWRICCGILRTSSCFIRKHKNL